MPADRFEAEARALYARTADPCVGVSRLAAALRAAERRGAERMAAHWERTGRADPWVIRQLLDEAGDV